MNDALTRSEEIDKYGSSDELPRCGSCDDMPFDDGSICQECQRVNS